MAPLSIELDDWRKVIRKYNVGNDTGKRVISFEMLTIVALYQVQGGENQIVREEESKAVQVVVIELAICVTKIR